MYLLFLIIYIITISSSRDVRIRSSEQLSQSWERHKIRSPNVVAIIARFNAIVKWVTSSVLGERNKLPTGKVKPKAIPRFLRTAEHLKNLHNYLSLSAMYLAVVMIIILYTLFHSTRYTGLSSSTIHYQHKNIFQTLTNQQQNTLHDIEKLLSHEGNYKNYRSAYEAVSAPCIPLFGVHLRDISFTGNENYNPF